MLGNCNRISATTITRICYFFWKFCSATEWKQNRSCDIFMISSFPTFSRFSAHISFPVFVNEADRLSWLLSHGGVDNPDDMMLEWTIQMTWCWSGQSWWHDAGLDNPDDMMLKWTIPMTWCWRCTRTNTSTQHIAEKSLSVSWKMQLH